MITHILLSIFLLLALTLIIFFLFSIFIPALKTKDVANKNLIFSSSELFLEENNDENNDFEDKNDSENHYIIHF